MTTFAELKTQVRDYLGDWETESRLTSVLTSDSTFMIVEDGTIFAVGDILYVNLEAVYVTNISINTLTIKRARQGTVSPASHPANTRIFRGATWTEKQIGEWVNESLNFIYPSMYIRVPDYSMTGSTSDWTYDLPAAITRPSQIEKVEIMLGANLTRTKVSKLRIVGQPPVLYIPAELSGYTIYVTYIKPFTAMSSETDVTDLPDNATRLPVYYAAARAMEQREAVRSRFDAYPVAQDERLTPSGANQAAGNRIWVLFNTLLSEVAMEPPGYVGSSI